MQGGVKAALQRKGIGNMGAFVTRQPNGLLCRFSSIVDCPTHYNMTDEEYIEMCEEIARAGARTEARDVLENHLKPFEWVKEYFRDDNMTQEEFEKILKKMEVPREFNWLRTET